MTSATLYQYVYASKITVRGLFDRSTLEEIREESRVFNPKHHITGVLCYANFRFFQCVEGTKEDLTILKGLLEKDPRHQDMQTLDFSPIERRRFRFWVMQALVLENWYLNDERFGEVMPFHKLIRMPDGWRTAVEHLAKLDATTDATRFDAITLTQSEIGFRLKKVTAEHQTFLFVQAILGLLVLISLIFMLKEVF